LPIRRKHVSAEVLDIVSRTEASVDRGRNSFDTVRLVAAMTVIVGHAFVLTGHGPAPQILGFPIHTLAVAVFFATSGYLIAGSWESNPNLVRFVRHRILRVFPALIAVVLITVFVIGPLITTRDLTTYFTSPQTWSYLQTVSTLARYELPGVFAGHPREAVNGSLWSLGVELVCYALVVVIGLLPPPARRTGYVLLATTAAALFFATQFNPALESFADASPVVVFFVGGALLRLTLPGHAYNIRTAALIFGGWAIATTLWQDWTTPLAWLALPYCVITLGRASSQASTYLARIGDISYGTYLWGFLVQQILIETLEPIPLPANIAFVLTGSMVLGWVSWIAIERPALSLKNRSNGA
jgi:peptidoglycan/LPS O-acetylase OafA/YrhL